MAAPLLRPMIDTAEFARKGLEIHDTIALSKFPRLQEMLADPEGKLDYALTGSVDAEGKPHLQLVLQGVMPLICQRCLEALDFELDASTDFILVPDESMIPVPEDENDIEDYLVANPHTQIVELLEEELLLALPYAPKHADEQCAAKSGVQTSNEKQSPFAILRGLKTKD